MKINWIRILIAGLWAEALLILIRIPILKYVESPSFLVGVLVWTVPMFLGGLWVARKIESRFILHGVLVGIVANILWIPLQSLLDLIVPPATTTTDTATQTGSDPLLWTVIILIVAALFKILGSTLGAYIGGKRWKKQPSAQAS
jgi:hypothetical protein